MSEVLIYYLANTLMRGGIIVSLLLILEFFLQRKLVFAGGRPVFILALMLVLFPLEKVEFPRSEAGTYTPARCIEVPDWNVSWEHTPAGAAPAAPIPLPRPEASAPEEAASPATMVPVKIPGRQWTLFDVMALLYLVSVLFLSAKQVRHYFIWRNRIRRCIAITGGRVSDVFRESKRLTGLERFPVMLLDGGDLLPVAACFGTLRNGAVLCPLREYERYTDSELRMILIHELEHLRRNDNPAAFFLMMLSNFFFVNPFIRIISSRWAMVAELDCDEKVKTKLQLDRQGMAQYAGLLLASQTGGHAHVPGCGLGASAANLKLRIQEFVMNRTKLQLLWYFSGICILFLLGSLLMPELRADTREPLDPFIANNLPAGTRELLYFNGAALDPNGIELLKKSRQSLRRHRDTISLMLATGQNKGQFYVATGPEFGSFMLLKNGTDSDELILSPGFWTQEMSARKLANGYFALFPAGEKLPPMGLSEELKQKIVATPNEVLRSCRTGDAPALVSVVNRDGVYTLSAIQPKKEDLPLESITNKAVFYLPEGEQDAMKSFIKENLKFTAKTVQRKERYEIEFPLTEKTLALWGDYTRKIREDREKEDEPKVIALSPENGATGVDPNLKEIKVTFDRPMSATSWSFCQKSDSDFPEVPSKPSFDESKTVITLPVKLVPGRTYNIYLNSPPYIGFRSAKGGVLQSVHYTFTTAE